MEHTNARTDARTHESEFIGSFRSLKTSGEPKKYINTAAANFKALRIIIINENFIAHSTEANSVRATISKICAKIIKI